MTPSNVISDFCAYQPADEAYPGDIALPRPAPALPFT